MKQKVGDIVGSTDVVIVQHGRGSSFDQQIGQVSDSERVDVRQDAEVTLESTLVEASALLNELRELPVVQRSAVFSAVAPIVAAATHDAIPTEVHVATLASAAVESAPTPLKATIRDLASAFSATSGAIAVTQLPTVEMLTIGVPAVLGITGYLAAPELRSLYQKISARVRTCLSQKSEALE